MTKTPLKNPKEKLDKIIVHVEYACFICGVILSSAETCIDHIKKIHRYSIPLRPESGQRPETNEFVYTDHSGGPWTIEEYACPSCWFHSPEDDLEALNEHVREEHNPIRIGEADEDTYQEKEYIKEIIEKLDELKVIFKDFMP